MAIKQITPQEAKELLDSDDSYVYLDVRSEMEFQQGHPENALNIPIQNVDMASQRMVENPDFIKVVEKNLPKDSKILVGCGSGPRSQAACQIMEQVGYKNVANVDGGFNGKRDMFGNVVKPGWAVLGFPVSQGDGGERSYRNLKSKSEQTE